jgi:hypothetical protein
MADQLKVAAFRDWLLREAGRAAPGSDEGS